MLKVGTSRILPEKDGGSIGIRASAEGKAGTLNVGVEAEATVEIADRYSIAGDETYVKLNAEVSTSVSAEAGPVLSGSVGVTASTSTEMCLDEEASIWSEPVESIEPDSSKQGDKK